MGSMMRFGRQRRRLRATGPLDGRGDERDQDPDESPETPTDEPSPARVQDPPAQSDSQGPYVVTVNEH